MIKDVTIIIPSMRASEFALEQCTDSLMKTAFDIVNKEMGLIVATNGYDPATDGKPNQVGDIHISFQGQCKAVNAAVAITNTEWIFVSNDDMVYPPNWWEKLSDFVENNRQIKCISPNLVEPRPGAPPFVYFPCGGAGGDFDKDKFYKFADKYRHFKLEEGFNLPFLMKRDLWNLIGGYDINYDPWGSNSDSDLQTKIYLAGEKTWRYHNVIVYHFGQTSGTFHPDNRKHWQKNRDYFIKKWGFPRQGDDQKVWYSKDLIDYEKLIYKPKWAVLR